jgi:hypothetical protein
MAIRVSKKSGDEYEVTVEERGSSTRHTVRVTPAVYDKLTGGAIPAGRLLELSFEFLLAREPKESILRRFELEVISQYFPDYERELRKKISG